MQFSSAEHSYRIINRVRGIVRHHSEEAALLADLRDLRPDLIHVHHFIGFEADFWDRLAELDIPYDITLHDYAFVCPRITLVDAANCYCGEPEDTAECDRCISVAGPHPRLQTTTQVVGGGMAAWRKWSAEALAGARRVYAPDLDVANRHRSYFPYVGLLIRAHPEPLAWIPARPPVDGERVRIAVIGSIYPHKGLQVLLACAQAAQRDSLPLTFVVIGELSDSVPFSGLDTVEVLGRYEEADLPRLIDEACCHAAAFFSVWPETHLYTLSAALRAGLYPIAFDIGASARRIKELGWGVTLPLGLEADEINQRLVSIAVNRPFPKYTAKIGSNYQSIIRDYLEWEPLVTAND